jgi:hypothetical protein
MTGTNYALLSGPEKLRVVAGRRKWNELAQERRRVRMRTIRSIVHNSGYGYGGGRIVRLVMQRLGVSRRTAYRDLQELRTHRGERLRSTGNLWD